MKQQQKQMTHLQQAIAVGMSALCVSEQKNMWRGLVLEKSEASVETCGEAKGVVG